LRSRPITLPLAALALIALLVSACSSPATVDDSGSTGGGSASGGSAGVPAALQKVYDAVKDQTGDQRRQTLVDLAKQEGGEVSYYSTMDDQPEVLDKFQQDTGIKINMYAGGNASIAQRVLQEAAANKVGADVIQAGTSELQLMNEQNVLADLQSPYRDQILEAGRHQKWLAPYVVASLVAWNTNNVKDPPKSLEDVFTRFPGKLALTAGDWDWFATVVKEYLVGEKGMTEEAAIDLVRQGAKGAQVQDDFTLNAQLLAAGEVDVYPEMFHHYLGDFERDKAPIAWEPAIQPIFLSVVGASVTNATKHPAAALLLVEYLLSDGQPVLAENGRTVANTSVKSGLDPDKYKFVPIPVGSEFSKEETEKWEGLWTDILQAK
jgi:iron(III) transport system substrate-binding protein